MDKKWPQMTDDERMMAIHQLSTEVGAICNGHSTSVVIGVVINMIKSAIVSMETPEEMLHAINHLHELTSNLQNGVYKVLQEHSEKIK